MADWRRFIEPMLKNHLEMQIKEVARCKGAYARADNPVIAQIWCSIAILSRQISELSLRMNYLERALKDIAGKKEKKKGKEDPAKMLKEVLKKQRLRA